MTIRFGPGPPPPARRRPYDTFAAASHYALGCWALIIGVML